MNLILLFTKQTNVQYAQGKLHLPAHPNAGLVFPLYLVKIHYFDLPL